MIIKLTYLFLAIFIFSSCETGYVQKAGGWYWQTKDEQFGSRVHVIEGLDPNSFKVLKNKAFALDKNQVYFQGKIIRYASPHGFIHLTDDKYGYAKDSRFVFLDNELIPGADPNTFEILTFPYSRDQTQLYCGNIPMRLRDSEISSFRVTNEDKLMAGMKSTAKIQYFIEYNPAFKFLDSLNPKLEYAITGDWGTGELNGRKFKGLYELVDGKLKKE